MSFGKIAFIAMNYELHNLELFEVHEVLSLYLAYELALQVEPLTFKVSPKSWNSGIMEEKIKILQLTNN